jgi:aminopeptidase N
LLAIWNDTEEQAYVPRRKTPGGVRRYAALGHWRRRAKNNELISAISQKPQRGGGNRGSSALVGIDAPKRLELEKFHARHAGDSLLVDKWFSLNSQVATPGAAARIEALMGHPDFRLSTPNRVYALIGGFTSMNLAGFHAADGEGYRVVADTILKVNALNPQVAARMATGFRSWRIMDEVRRKAAAGQLERILASPGLSRDCIEIVSKTLKG